MLHIDTKMIFHAYKTDFMAIWEEDQEKEKVLSPNTFLILLITEDIPLAGSVN